MAKTIKFNLICDDKPVRTIDDLQNNFSIEDVLAYYNNKLLHRWLKVRGYSDELEKISAITSEKPLEIIKELIKVFNVVSNEKTVEESVYMLEYLDKRKELCSIYDKENYKTKSIIDDYEIGYRQLLEDILGNPNDAAKIKANIAEMVTNYKWVLDLNHRELFWILKDKSTLALMCLLMNERSRYYYLPKKSMIKAITAVGKAISRIFSTTASDATSNDALLKKDGDQYEEITKDLFKSIASRMFTNTASGATSNDALLKKDGVQYEQMNKDKTAVGKAISSMISTTASGATSNDALLKKDGVQYEEMNKDKIAMYQEICRIIQASDLKDMLGENLLSFAGITDGYWKDLKPKGKKYMIISMGSGDFVRSAGVSGGDLANTDVTNEFVIVDGIDYKSNSLNRQLLYMEV